ncbi:MAG: uracil-DNA glycosylase [Clostridia bacterium]|nr:uracil-DNA glycosylase [Clostridia bacterium]
MEADAKLDAFWLELEKWMRESYPERKLVRGEGANPPVLMLIGEAPGGEEEKLGRPFVGKAGKNLNEFLSIVGLDRSALYITNTVKFRPTRVSAAGRLVNRTPTQAEIAAFRPWLMRELAFIAPDCVVTLGNVPLKALMGRNAVIGDLHGQFVQLEGIRLYPIYHPASLIYNPSLREVYAQDLLKLAQWARSIES